MVGEELWWCVTVSVEKQAYRTSNRGTLLPPSYHRNQVLVHITYQGAKTGEIFTFYIYIN